MSKKITRVEQLRKKYPTATLIKGWDDFKAWVKENGPSETHKIVIEDHSGHMTCLKPKSYNPKKSYSNQVIYIDHYLSTHTFDNFASNTKKLQKCGFNVILDNWGRKE